jgi:hypothetical protein
MTAQPSEPSDKRLLHAIVQRATADLRTVLGVIEERLAVVEERLEEIGELAVLAAGIVSGEPQEEPGEEELGFEIMNEEPSA